MNEYSLNSDPGTSGILSPFSDIHGMYFNDEDEPNDMYYNLNKQIDELLDSKGINYIKIHTDSKEEYYKVLDKITDFYKNGIEVTGIPINNDIIIDNDETK